MSLPRVLKQFLLYNEGAAYLGEVPTVTLPKLATKNEAYRAGGMLGEVEIDMGLESLKLEWTAGGWLTDAIKQFGITQHDGVMLRFAGAIQSPDSELAQAVEVVVRGRHSEVDFGSAEAAKKTEHKYITTCSYYKLTVAGEELVEIDLVRGIFAVGGIDRNASLRAAMGVI
jgi:P2 family phage contractile tail tube protein